MTNAGNETAGLAALYVVSELVKFFVKNKSKGKGCAFSGKNQAMLERIHQTVEKEDSTGRPLIYTPKNLHSENERMLEMVESITRHQKETAIILRELINKK